MSSSKTNSEDCQFRKRPSWKTYFIEVAKLISQRSISNKLQVGCVITKDNRIVSSGYNGFISGAKHELIVKDNHEVFIHAETNCIAESCKVGISIANSTMYITHFPCLNCTLLIIAAGVKHIIYNEDYNNDPIAIKMLKLANVTIEKYTNNDENN